MKKGVVIAFSLSLVVNVVLVVGFVFRPHLSQRSFNYGWVGHLHGGVVNLEQAQKQARTPPNANAKMVSLALALGSTEYSEGLVKAWPVSLHYQLLQALMQFNSRLQDAIALGHTSPSQLQPFTNALVKAVSDLKPSMKSGRLTPTMTTRAVKSLDSP